jgi:hypothetical protein
VSVHEVLGGIEFLTVSTNQLLAGLRAATPGDTLEGCTVSERAPKPMLETKTGLNDELGQVMWKVSSRRHRGPLKTLAPQWDCHPRAQASVVHLVEHHLHTTWPSRKRLSTGKKSKT